MLRLRATTMNAFQHFFDVSMAYVMFMDVTH